MSGISFLFGTVTAAHNADSIRDLKNHLDHSPNLEWIRDTASELPGYWDLLVGKVDAINDSLPGRQMLEDFERRLRHGIDSSEGVPALGNTVILPLVIMLSLAEFWQYAESQSPSCEDPLKSFLQQHGGSQVESIGMCAGMLPAFAVASSHSRQELEKYGAVAIRLAMILGAATDAQDARNGPAKSYVAAWRTQEQEEVMKRSIKLVYPQAYMSVSYDERRVTITTTAQWIRPTIMRQLQGAGLTVRESDIHGPIHCPGSESKDIADQICELLSTTPTLQFADVENLACTTYTNDGHTNPVRNCTLHEEVVRSSLATQCLWYETFQALPFVRPDSTQKLVSFGLDRCVPPSLVASLSARWTHFSTIPKGSTPTSHTPVAARMSSLSTARLSPSKPEKSPENGIEKTPEKTSRTVSEKSEDNCQEKTREKTREKPLENGSGPAPEQVAKRTRGNTPEESQERAPKQQHQDPKPPRLPSQTIAIVGMSIKTAGADDIDEYSQMIRSGVSQHELIGPDRIKFHTLWREGDWDPSYKWYGNFMRDIDKFDHQFFKRSPREAATMDPQQRLSLQAAYQAVESAGYYTRDRNPRSSEKRRNQMSPKHIGVYVGVTVDDYQSHVRSHKANAFSVTGSIRSLMAGKIAHHFGWTGPAMTLDTACSSSSVAIHLACRDLLAGDTNAALAGGANVTTDPLVFQDLAAAGFLSPSGQCKPFDDRADGYCRGEAVGFVFLKRLEDALADGSQILGCITSSAVYQNENHTPIFVPNSPSLSCLFGDVMRKAQVQPSDISVVECHGTGTPVGDPAEWESVSQAVGGFHRTDPVYLGSAKGHIGHTEAASGVVGLIKLLNMMHGGYIPPQASFSQLSHLIKPSDTMQIATSQQPWQTTHKVALFNNYGASGSNVAMVVAEPPSSCQQDQLNTDEAIGLPFCIAGRTVNAVKAICTRILSYLDVHSGTSLVDLSFNMYRQFNPSLPQRLAFKCGSLDDFKTKLSQVVTASPEAAAVEVTSIKPNRPVILCFGGQVSTSIGLDRNLYDRAQILRHYLDECDTVIQSFGLQSIYPDIFSQKAVQDQQHLQTMLFAMQYSCAMCWLQSGFSSQVAALVGHSFGELTAMCVSGVLSLHDGVKLVAGRARLIRDLWGADSGAMLAVEADKETVDTLLSEASRVYGGPHQASIACYNGPQSFTLAGSQQAIGVVIDLVSKKFPGIRSKRLQVTNAFHSSFVDPLEQQLETLGQGMTFQKPRIPLERTTETRLSMENVGPRYPVEQMRKPVFFYHAVQRLAQDYPDCVWLEAGSSSTVTIMAQRALDSAPRSSHHFQAVKINDPNASNNLGDATVSLWKKGVSTSFWPHNAIQTHDYATLTLPPYQFEKDRHWVELRSPVELIEQIKQTVRSENATLLPQTNVVEDPNRRWTFTGYKDSDKRRPCFHINTAAEEYQMLVSSHVTANTTGICSGMLQVKLTTGALFSIHPEWTTNGFSASVHDVSHHAPIVLNSSRILAVEFENEEDGSWNYKLVGVSENGGRILHTTGHLRVRDPKDVVYQAGFRRCDRLVDHERCLDLLHTGPQHDDVEILQKRNIYRAFRDVVDFGIPYQSLRWLVGRGNESAGQFSRTPQNDAWFELLRGEHISQVGGVWINCMTDHSPDDVFLGSEIEMFMISPEWANKQLPDKCNVFARHQLQKGGDCTTDSFVFDSVSGELVEVLLGARYTRTSRASFTRALQRMTSDLSAGNMGSSSTTMAQPALQSVPRPAPAPVASSRPVVEPPETSTAKPQSAKAPAKDLIKAMGEVVANLIGIAVTDIGPDDNLANFGLDSLLGLELQAEIKNVFKCEPDEGELMGAPSLRHLVKCLPIASEQDTVGDATSSVGDSSPTEVDSTPQPSDAPLSDSMPTSISPPDLLWSTSNVLESFSVTKRLGDQKIKEYGLDNFTSVVLPESNRLVVALIVEGFEQLGCSLRSASAGSLLNRIPCQPQHKIYVDWIYDFLSKTEGLVTTENSGQLMRTSKPIPTASSHDVLQDLLGKYNGHDDFLRLTYHAGTHLAQALSGQTDGNRVLMSHPEGRKLCQSVYHNYPLNRIGFDTMRDVLSGVSKQIRTSGPLRVLEMGAGTGSATSALLPLLASLDIPVEYTYTDLSSSLVAQARRKLGTQYPFMRFAVQDIEKPVPDELAGKQHIVVASHCVHATHSLTESTRNIRQALRPDGFLMMLECRESWPALDLTFGLYEGWWLFEDGRTQVYTTPDVWKRHLTDAGYRAVDWTDGALAEHNYYMVVIALASAM